MRKLLIVTFLLSFIIVINAKSQSKVILTVTLKNSESISEIYLKERIVPNKTKTDTAFLSDEANFKFKLQPTEPNYYILRLGDEYIDLFLALGDSLNLTIDVTNPLDTIKITGKGKLINEYLVSKMKIEQNNSLKITDYGLSRHRFTTKNDSILRFINENFERFIATNNGISPYFIACERELILCEWMLKLFNYPNQYRMQHKIKNNEIDSSYYNFLTKLDIENDQLLKFWQYTGCLSWYFMYKIQENFGEEFYKNTDKEWKLEFFKLIPKVFANEAVRNYVYFYEMHQEISHKTRKKHFDEIYNQFKKNCTSPHHLSYIENMYEASKAIEKGRTAPDFTCIDTLGKSFSLNDFKGKYIYVDLWASWCAPCIKEIPYFEKLKNEFKDRNIVFLSISVDENVEKWKKTLKKENMKGAQFYAGGEYDSEIKKIYNINSLPRFILIDRDGKIINSDAKRPSEIREILQNLESI